MILQLTSAIGWLELLWADLLYHDIWRRMNLQFGNHAAVNGRQTNRQKAVALASPHILIEDRAREGFHSSLTALGGLKGVI